MAIERQADLAVRFYEGRARTYDFTWHTSFAERFNGFLSIEGGQHVLDLACGTGLLTFLEADQAGPNGKVVGVDITPGMLSKAKDKKEKGGDKYTHVELYEGDILNLEAIDALKGQTFDLITLASALVLLPDPKAAVKYWTKFLKPGGILAVDSTHPRNLVSGMIMERTARRLSLPIPYNREWSDSEDALGEVLESAGLDVEQIVTVDNQAGYGRRHYDLEHWEDHFVEKIIMGDTARTFADREVRMKAHGIFKEEFEKLAVNGKVEEVDAVFLGIARKPLEGETQKNLNPKVVFSGGCRCGAVKYKSTAPPAGLTFCHCRACQQLSGSGYLPFVHVPSTAIKLTESSILRTLKLSDVAERTFCSACGSPISMVYAFEPDVTGITASSVDPESYKGEWPKIEKHIYLEEKAPWDTVPEDGAERHQTSTVAHLINPARSPGKRRRSE